VLLEIGTEELPAADLSAALDQLAELAPKLFDDLRLEHQGVRVMGTPRRLVVHAQAVALRQPDVEILVKGPPASRAFDARAIPQSGGRFRAE